METIIGLLFILLPVIFKAIGNKLEKSGQAQKAGKVREIAKALGADEEFDDDGQITFVEPVEPVVPIESVAPAVPAPPAAQTARRRSLLKEEETSKKKGEKIDPKKLVIYSEIMKPKYNE